MSEIWKKLSGRKKPKQGTSQLKVEDLQNVEVEVFPYSHDPTIAWELLKTRYPAKSCRPLKLTTPMKNDHIRFVCISDTHSLHNKVTFDIPDGDILIVAGDFTTCGHPGEIDDFNRFIGNLPHRYKIIIAGNHELTLDDALRKTNFMGFERMFKNFDSKGTGLRNSIVRALEEARIDDVRDLLTNCIYLEDSMVEIYGIKIYGTPWQPAFDNWAFNLPRGYACLNKWKNIPPLVDVLITHGPPLGHGDLTANGVRAGCVELLQCVARRVRPKFMIFGHIHEGYGCTSDGYTTFINCSTCDLFMHPVNPPIIFDIPLPPGCVK